MIDFSSALYLGFRNPSQALAPWERLTLGKPAALEELPATAKASADIASLLGCERALLTPSTLHAYVDLFEIFAKSRVALFVDSGVYAITRWNVERAGAKGIPYWWFSHFDADSAATLLHSKRLEGRIPVILTDGICTACGCAAPLNPLLRQVSQMGGWLVVDDTQAVGILGNFPNRRNPYGAGGGGSFRYHGINSPNVWTISSLAKAFGTPLTVVGASAENIGMFEEHSMTRVHCSPPSAALLHAAEYAIRRNRLAGDHLRNRLLRAVLRFRKEMGEAGLELRGGILPTQTLALRHSRLAFELHDKLLAIDVQAVLHRERRDEPAALSFLLTAEHSFDQIVQTRIAIEALLHQGKRSRNQLQRKKEDQTDESGIAI